MARYELKVVLNANGNKVFYRQKDSSGVWNYVIIDTITGARDLVTKDFVIHNQNEFKNVGVSGNRLYIVNAKKN